MIALAKPDNLIAFPDVAPQGKSNEWYTPARYIEAARKVMGSIDLDPASCEMANRTVRAARYYTKEDDGLSKAWHGNVWLNPPFSEQSVWSKKLLREYNQERITQVCLLAQAATERVWFQHLWNYLLCFTDHQIIFERAENKPYHIYHGTCFVYFGPNEQKFIEVFSQFGRIAKAIDTPKVHPVNLSLWAVQS